MSDTPTPQEAAESGLSSHALFACPFCGGDPTVTDIHSDEIRRKDDEARAQGHLIPGMYNPWKSHFLNIKCHNCDIGFDGTLVDAMGDFTAADVRKSREKLLTKWNTRLGQPKAGSDARRAGLPNQQDG